MVSATGHRFSEQETEEYYDAEDVIYRSVWDADGSVHWGVFDKNADGSNIREEFLAAGIRLNELMVEYGGIDGTSKVLDVGCGNGNAAIWLARNSGAHVTGVDLSGVRVANAVESLKDVPELADRLAFEKSLGHRPALPGGNLHPLLEPGHHLPRARQGEGAGGSASCAADRRHDDLR